MLRKIDGVWRECLDIGCPDPERARQNREMVKNKENIEGYVWAEAILERLHGLLPAQLIGILPQVGKTREHRNYEGGADDE